MFWSKIIGFLIDWKIVISLQDMFQIFCPDFIRLHERRERWVVAILTLTVSRARDGATLCFDDAGIGSTFPLDFDFLILDDEEPEVFDLEASPEVVGVISSSSSSMVDDTTLEDEASDFGDLNKKIIIKNCTFNNIYYSKLLENKIYWVKRPWRKM